MADVILFVKNFRLGTMISEGITDLDQTVEFAEDEQLGLEQIGESTKTAIIDFDDPVYQTIAFVSGLRNLNKNMKIAGYMEVIHNETYERLKSAGCNIILPRSSFVKNISTLIS